MAARVSETGAEFGGAVDIAVFGSIGVAVYRGRLAKVADTVVLAVLARRRRGACETCAPCACGRGTGRH